MNVALGVLESQGFIRRTTPGRFLAGDAPPGTIAPDLRAMWERQEGDLDRLARMIEYATTLECRRGVLLRYFGEAMPADTRCGHCDRCEVTAATSVRERIVKFFTGSAGGNSGRSAGRRTARRDGETPPAPPERLASAILSAVPDLQRFHLGVSGVSKVLCGSESHLIERLRLRESPHYGRLSGTAQKTVAESVQQLVEEGRLRRTGGALPAVELAVVPMEAAESTDA